LILGDRVKIDVRIYEKFVEKSLLFVRVNFERESILDEPGAYLVEATLHHIGIDDIKREVLGHILKLIFGLLCALLIVLLRQERLTFAR